MVHLTSVEILTLVDYAIDHSGDNCAYRFTNKHFPLSIHNNKKTRQWLTHTLEYEKGRMCSRNAFIDASHCKSIKIESFKSFVFGNVNTLNQWQDAYQIICASNS